jgi:hypothetical protein
MKQIIIEITTLSYTSLLFNKMSLHCIHIPHKVWYHGSLNVLNTLSHIVAYISAPHFEPWALTGSNRLGTVLPLTASEPIGTRDPVSFYDTVDHDGELIIYDNSNVILATTLY